jgi:hypothetical protein
MAIKRTSLQDVFRMSGPKMLEDAKDALSDADGGLLDELSCYPIGFNRAAAQESEKAEAALMKAREIDYSEIDYSRTSDEMILDGNLVLNDAGKR